MLFLIIGLVAGAAGVYFVALRRALAERDQALEGRGGERGRRSPRSKARWQRSGAPSTSASQTSIRALSAEALRANAQSFTDAAMGRLGEYVEPLRKSLEKVETNVGLLEQQRQRAYGEIHKELEIVRETHESLRTQTGNLVNALRGESHTRGRWGEIQLRRVIEMAGMLSYCDFDEQPVRWRATRASGSDPT